MPASGKTAFRLIREIALERQDHINQQQVFDPERQIRPILTGKVKSFAQGSYYSHKSGISLFFRSPLEFEAMVLLERSPEIVVYYQDAVCIPYFTDLVKRWITPKFLTYTIDNKDNKDNKDNNACMRMRMIDVCRMSKLTDRGDAIEACHLYCLDRSLDFEVWTDDAC